MSPFRSSLGLAVVLVLGACRSDSPVREDATTSAPRTWTLETAPAEFQPSLQKANTAMNALQAGLLQKLLPALEQGGPVGAIDVCATEAQAITEKVVAEQAIRFGRTSHKLRNPKNAVPAWAAAHVKQHAGARAADVQPLVFDLGDKVGLLRPVPTGAMCLNCHGPEVRPEVVAAIEARYPTDQARGFSEGDLRGFFWAEVPKQLPQ